MEHGYLQYTVGNVYEATAEECFPVTVKDKEEFCILLMDEMQKLCDKMNTPGTYKHEDFILNGVVIPLQDFIYFSESEQKWQYEEPVFHSFPETKDPLFIVTTLDSDEITYSYPTYHFVQAKNKDELEIALKSGFADLMKNPELSGIDINGTYISRSDIVHYERKEMRRNNKKGSYTGDVVYNPIYNVSDIESKENWCNFIELPNKRKLKVK